MKNYPCLPAGRDHRLGKKFSNIEKILGGDLGKIVKAFSKR
jgi:hypothetical protein